jgi:hypothetical protein
MLRDLVSWQSFKSRESERWDIQIEYLIYIFSVATHGYCASIYIYIHILRLTTYKNYHMFYKKINDLNLIFRPIFKYLLNIYYLLIPKSLESIRVIVYFGKRKKNIFLTNVSSPCYIPRCSSLLSVICCAIFRRYLIRRFSPNPHILTASDIQIQVGFQ